MLFHILFVALFVSLCFPLSPQRMDGISKWTGPYVKLDLLFILQACNWCTETFAVNCILDLPLCFYFLFQIPPCSLFLPDGFQCDTVAHTDETPCCLTLPRAGCGRYKWNIDIYHSVQLTRHTVSAIHYCEECSSFLFNCDIRPIVLHYWPRVCVHIIMCFWC